MTSFLLWDTFNEYYVQLGTEFTNLFVIITPSSIIQFDPTTMGPPMDIIFAFGWMTVPVIVSLGAC
jgi:hypothetical protein